MTFHPLTIVCPVDYSDCSKRALRFAGAIAEHFGARLSVLHVFAPRVAGVAAIHHFDLIGADGQEELGYLIQDHLPSSLLRDDDRLDRVLAVGSPSDEIVAFVRSRDADLLVMGTHGFSGVRKAVFGSTLQDVLRRVHVPVLAVPIVDHRETGVRAALISSGPVLAPVDFSPESKAAAHAADGLARALGLPLALLHVIGSPEHQTSSRQRQTLDDRSAVEDPAALMRELVESMPAGASIDDRIVCGEPAEQIARFAREKRAAMIVMSLGTSAMRARTAPGSIAYRVLCLAPVPVLALPETPAGRLYVQHLDHGGRAAHTR
jgi:universal stress protein A